MGGRTVRIGGIAALVSLAWTAGSLFASPPELIRIDSDDPLALAPLADGPAPPVRILDGYALAWGSGADLSEICGFGFDAVTLGSRLPGMEYVVVYVGPRGAGGTFEIPATYGRTLHRGEHTAVLETPHRSLEILEAAYEFVPVLDRPVRFGPILPHRLPPPPVEPDRQIAEWVEDVAIDSLFRVSRRLEDFVTRRSNSQGCRDAGAFLAGLLEAYGVASVGLFDYPPTDWCDNVIGWQPGSIAPEEIYVIGGHYDSTSNASVAPGADDNASGTAAVVEAARILAPREFEATIVYAAFGGEEQGLVGSEAWASWARSNGLDVRGMINLDMIGYLPPGAEGDLDVIGGGPPSDLLDLAFAVAAVYLPDYRLVRGFLSGGNSDQQSFWDHGYPAIFLHEDSLYRNPHYHTANDRVGPSLNDFGFMRRNVQAAVALLATLARPLRVRIAHRPVVDPPSGGDGYRVVARIESNAPLWTDSLLVRYRVDEGAWSAVAMEALAAAGDSFAATIPAQAPGNRVEYLIYARDIEGRTTADPPRAPAELHSFVVGLEMVFEDDFDEDLGWTVGDPGDEATSGIWVRARPIGTGAQPFVDAWGDSTGFCFLTGNGVPGGEIGAADLDGGRTTLTSPPIDLSGAIGMRVDYHRWFVDETFPDDTLRVYLSSDDGVTWTLLESVGRSERAWRPVRFDRLERALAPTGAMRLRIVAEDIGSPSLVEAAVDRVQVRAVYPAPAPPPPPLAGGFAAGPLPSGGPLRFSFRLDAPADVRIDLFNVQGRKVAEIESGARDAGPQAIDWEGGGSGHLLPGGIYFARLVVDGRTRGQVRVPLLR